MDAVLTPHVVIGVVIVTAIALVYGWRVYQRCPHCGRIVPRVARGWKRCQGCGRQYRKGLRLR